MAYDICPNCAALAILRCWFADFADMVWAVAFWAVATAPAISAKPNSIALFKHPENYIGHRKNYVLCRKNYV